MKIRIKGNFVRIRLSKSEVGMFAKEGYVEESTDFGNSIFSYAVKSTGNQSMSADFINGKIILYVPQNLIEEWANSTQVGIVCDVPVSNGNFLSLLLEKDFKCIDTVVTEDQSDYFENPAKSC
jgi:predicted nucleic acid-binding protein